jgi:predicted TIM-barrel fold metal-dependent hydrolase
VPWSVSAPRKFGKIIGEALRFAGPDRIIWGTDYAGFSAQIGGAVKGFRDYQIPEDLRADYGYPEITDEDRQKIFGENLARLLGIETNRRI